MKNEKELEKEVCSLKFPSQNKTFNEYDKVWIYQDGLIYPALVKTIINENLIIVLKYDNNLWINVVTSPTLLLPRKHNLSELIYYNRKHFFDKVWNGDNGDILND